MTAIFPHSGGNFFRVAVSFIAAFLTNGGFRLMFFVCSEHGARVEFARRKPGQNAY